MAAVDRELLLGPEPDRMSPNVRLPIALALLVSASCATAPPPAPPPPPSYSYEQKLGWILYLEDARVLRDPQPLPAPPPPITSPAKRAGPVAVPPLVYPDLRDLLQDPDPRLRRRAAIAIGRVGMVEGAEPLLPLLRDADPDVRTMAAFGLGLLGDARAVGPLTAALDDADWRVRGRAADALGRVGDAAAAPAVGKLASSVVDSGALASIADRRSRVAARSRGRSVPPFGLRAGPAEGVGTAGGRGARRTTASRGCGGGPSPTPCNASRTRAPCRRCWRSRPGPAPTPRGSPRVASGRSRIRRGSMRCCAWRTSARTSRASWPRRCARSGRSVMRGRPRRCSPWRSSRSWTTTSGSR